MSNLTNEEKLKKILKKVENDSISYYKLGKNTNLTQAAVARILKGESKNPHSNSINEIYNYLFPKDITENPIYQAALVMEDEDLYNKIKRIPKPDLLEINKAMHKKVLEIIKDLEAIENPTVNVLKELKNAREFLSEINHELDLLQ